MLVNTNNNVVQHTEECYNYYIQKKITDMKVLDGNGSRDYLLNLKYFHSISDLCS